MEKKGKKGKKSVTPDAFVQPDATPTPAQAKPAKDFFATKRPTVSQTAVQSHSIQPLDYAGPSSRKSLDADPLPLSTQNLDDDTLEKRARVSSAPQKARAPSKMGPGPPKSLIPITRTNPKKEDARKKKQQKADVFPRPLRGSPAGVAPVPGDEEAEQELVPPVLERIPSDLRPDDDAASSVFFFDDARSSTAPSWLPLFANAGALVDPTQYPDVVRLLKTIPDLSNVRKRSPIHEVPIPP